MCSFMLLLRDFSLGISISNLGIWFDFYFVALFDEVCDEDEEQEREEYEEQKKYLHDNDS
jgi:hypothetical protein